MKAMILAAGRGERMRPLTDDLPKPLLEAGGKTLVGWHLSRLAAAGFEDVVINHAHLGIMIENALGDGAGLGIRIRYSAEVEALETAGGIANALSLLGDSFLVVNGDIWCDFDFASIRSSLAAEDLAHLVLVNNPTEHPAGDFRLSDGKARQEGTPSLTFSGIGIYRAELFRNIIPGQKAKLAPILRAAMVDERVSAEHYKGRWRDIGTPERLLSLRQELGDKSRR